MADTRDFVFSYNAVSWICDSRIYYSANKKLKRGIEPFGHMRDIKKKRLNIQREY